MKMPQRITGETKLMAVWNLSRLRVCRYMERNPLSAGDVERAENWHWGSLSLGETPSVAGLERRGREGGEVLHAIAQHAGIDHTGAKRSRQ